MSAPRLQDWPSRLDAFIEQRRRTGFAWGTQDCCQFARRAIEAQTGADPAAALGLADYDTVSGALAELERLGGIEVLPERAGLAAVAVAFARRGDLVLVESLGRPALGLCLGRECAAPSAAGLVFLPMTAATKAWRVGGEG